MRAVAGIEVCSNALADADLASDAVDQLFGIVADAGLKHRFHVLDVCNVSGWIAFDQNEVGLFARRERADAIPLAKIYRAVFRADLNRLRRSESRFDQQFYFALIAESGKHAAISGRVGACKQQASRFG